MFSQSEIKKLLGREEFELDSHLPKKSLEGQTVFVTGAGGSIGSEIVRQVITFKPKRVILFGHGEYSIFKIYQELQTFSANQMTELIPVIADIQSAEAVTKYLKLYSPSIIYHAAAHKHVPLMEANPVAAYLNNIIGTRNLVRAVDELGIPKMIMLSTDKAAKPSNVMGASKRIAELLLAAMNQVSDSTFCSVRFGNVLGSRGSVVPIFMKMIEAGGPVQVTDFQMTRYFMTVKEAARLVIHAGAVASGEELMVLNMGAPLKIYDLAERLISLSGQSGIDIVETKCRPGDKLHEELLTDEELVQGQINDQIYIGRVPYMSLDKLNKKIDNLAEFQSDDVLMREKLIELAQML